MTARPALRLELPTMPEAEAALVGALLENPSAVAALPSLGLEGGEFADPAARAAFAAVRALAERGEAVDTVSAFDVLRQRGQADLCPLVDLNMMASRAARLDALPRHAASIRKAHRASRLRALGASIAAAATDPEEVAALAREVAATLAEAGGHAARAFGIVPTGDLAHTEQPLPLAWWDGYLPAGHVTLLSAHGGVGKSLVAMMLAVCVALGLPLFGIPTRRGRVVYFSGEDAAELLRHRLALVCRHIGESPAALDGWLQILDATGHDPALFREVTSGGQRVGVTTPTYEALLAHFEAMQADVLIVDNASDTFDAPEIQRAAVRGFMRALARIAQARGGAVLLLAHVDKATARGNASGADSYSGSTAFHNSARSRIALTRTADGGLRLEHQKNNLGRLRDPLDLAWPEHGLPGELAPMGPLSRRLLEQADTRALLALLHEFTSRGESVSTATTSRASATALLGGQKGYPRRKPAETFNMLRDAERAGLVTRETWRGTDRKPRERWALTAAGLEFIGARPST